MATYWGGSKTSDGGACRLRGSGHIEVQNCRVEQCARGLRVQDCGHAERTSMISNCMTYCTLESGIYAAMVESAVDKGRPFLGICVGMQLMASMGREYEDTAGLGWISGEVTKITPRDPSLKVPHMGWNDLVIEFMGRPLGFSVDQ